MPVILEGIVTTLASDGTPNIAPMGPEVDASMRSLVLKPFRSSTTYQNLKQHGEGVFHVTDDVLLLARTAVGAAINPTLKDATAIRGKILADACRWYAFRVTQLDDEHERTRIVAKVIDSDAEREFLGFNRAKHAVLEGAILATRLHLLPPTEILAQFEALRPLVEKTGGEQERVAFAFLEEFVRGNLPGANV
jgi:hypothetical protein